MNERYNDVFNSIEDTLGCISPYQKKLDKILSHLIDLIEQDENLTEKDKEGILNGLEQVKLPFYTEDLETYRRAMNQLRELL